MPNSVTSMHWTTVLSYTVLPTCVLWVKIYMVACACFLVHSDIPFFHPCGEFPGRTNTTSSSVWRHSKAENRTNQADISHKYTTSPILSSTCWSCEEPNLCFICVVFGTTVFVIVASLELETDSAKRLLSCFLVFYFWMRVFLLASSLKSSSLWGWFSLSLYSLSVHSLIPREKSLEVVFMGLMDADRDGETTSFLAKQAITLARAQLSYSKFKTQQRWRTVKSYIVKT